MYGGSLDGIESLLLDEALFYADEAQASERRNYRMLLAISTNPHITPSHKQKRLWDDLKAPWKPQPIPDEAREVLEKLESDFLKRKGSGNGV